MDGLQRCPGTHEGTMADLQQARQGYLGQINAKVPAVQRYRDSCKLVRELEDAKTQCGLKQAEVRAQFLKMEESIQKEENTLAIRTKKRPDEWAVVDKLYKGLAVENCAKLERARAMQASAEQELEAEGKAQAQWLDDDGGSVCSGSTPLAGSPGTVAGAMGAILQALQSNPALVESLGQHGQTAVEVLEGWTIGPRGKGAQQASQGGRQPMGYGRRDPSGPPAGTDGNADGNGANRWSHQSGRGSSAGQRQTKGPWASRRPQRGAHH